jgi:hypothetical protein
VGSHGPCEAAAQMGVRPSPARAAAMVCWWRAGEGVAQHVQHARAKQPPPFTCAHMRHAWECPPSDVAAAVALCTGRALSPGAAPALCTRVTPCPLVCCARCVCAVCVCVCVYVCVCVLLLLLLLLLRAVPAQLLPRGAGGVHAREHSQAAQAAACEYRGHTAAQFGDGVDAAPVAARSAEGADQRGPRAACWRGRGRRGGRQLQQ